MKSEVKLGERDVETMKLILRETFVVEFPSMRVMKNVIQEKNEGPGEAEVQEFGGNPEFLKREVEGEIPIEIGLVEAVDLAAEVQVGTTTGNLILFSYSELPVSVQYSVNGLVALVFSIKDSDHIELC